jgi:peptidoglycan hydrolase CwlO-like protein
VRPLALLRRARGLAVLGAAGLGLAVTPAAHADTTGDAQARARAILQHVQKLQREVKQAEQRYDAALSGVASSVNDAILAERTHDELASQTASASAMLDQRIRDLYMSGGTITLYASLMSSGSINDLQTKLVMVNSLVGADHVLVHADNAVVAQAASLAAQAQHRVRRQIATERSVAQVAQRVMRLLDEQQKLLDQANAQVAQSQALDAARAALAAQAAAFSGITASRIASMNVLPASPQYMQLYHDAARTCPGLSWTVLAAIGQVESGHGRNPSTSYAGAMGPMQFLPATFAHYGVDGDHDGVLDIMDPADAIYTAAAYLCANGAGQGGDMLYNAIWHYNHADWYVQMVLTLARKYAA